MKSLVTSLAGGNYTARALEKQQVSNNIRARGGTKLPQPPRDVQVQPASGGVLVTWKLPTNHENISGWRVYLNTEQNLAVQIRDKGTKQAFVPLSSGASPSAANIMVSAITNLGRESSKVVKQATPSTQTTTTTVPTTPPGYLDESSGGANRRLLSFNGQTQYTQ